MKNFYVPNRFKGRTGYQIFVDRYFDAGIQIPEIEGRRLKNWNDSIPDWRPDTDGVYKNEYFYGGNLQGIIQKLDFIKSIGFNLIYLSPISQTHTNHHYDVEDQLIIDPYIGTWEDFKKLCDEAHKRDILICVDLVFNHMGAKSKAFQEAIHGNSNYSKWFEFNSIGNPVFWYGFTDMPQCNKLNEEFQEYSFEVAKKYITNGADGIRLDLGEILPFKFLSKFRDNVKKFNEEVLIVNEMWDLDTHRSNSQLDGNQADSVMNYPLADAILRWVRWGNDLHMQYTLNELSKYPNEARDVLWNLLDSHDVPRATTMLVGEGMCQDPYLGRIWDIESPWRTPYGFNTYDFRKWERNHEVINMEEAIKSLKLASLVQYLVKGTPVVFYGTEAGICGYKDPFNRKPYPWNNLNIELLNHYQSLGQMRKTFMEIFASGEQDQIITTETMKITRYHNGQKIVGLINRCGYEVSINNLDTGGSRILNINNCSCKFLSPKGAVVYYY